MTNQIDQNKLLIHFRRLSDLLGNAFRNGPDGSLEDNFEAEHPQFIHYSCAIYLSGVLCYLAGEDGEYSWNKLSAANQNFDQFATFNPGGTRPSFASHGITKSSLDALAQLRNALVHHDGDLSKNRNANSLNMVVAASFPGVSITGTVASLEQPFLEHARLSVLAVRYYIENI